MSFLLLVNLCQKQYNFCISFCRLLVNDHFVVFGMLEVYWNFVDFSFVGTVCSFFILMLYITGKMLVCVAKCTTLIL